SERHRHAVRAKRLAQRLHADPGNGDDDRRRLRGHQSRGRPALCGVRPAHPVHLMAVAALPSAPALPKRRSAILDFIRQQPLGAASFVVIFVMMFAGIFAEYVAPYDPLGIDFAGILAAPSWEHWGGTDAFGRDILSRIIYGSRTALVIGFSSSFLGS